MLLRNLGSDDGGGQLAWQDLAVGAPAIIAFATLCGRAMSKTINPEPLSDHAKALLAASDLGVFEIRGNQEGFESADRFLAICIEVNAGHRLLFRQKDNPRETMNFLQGFAELCQSGLVMHHLHREFSLTRAGYEAADSHEAHSFQTLIDFANIVEH